MSEKLLEDVRNYLDITYQDAETDKKITGIVARGIAKLDGIAGTKQDYETEGRPRALLFDYCRYARNNVVELFEENFQSDLIALRMGGQANDFAEEQGYI